VFVSLSDRADKTSWYLRKWALLDKLNARLTEAGYRVKIRDIRFK
jgi:hypothetical protein